MYKQIRQSVWGLGLSLIMMTGLLSCHHNSVDPIKEESSEILKIPVHFPPLTYNLQNNPITQERFELGRQLFFDPLFSSDGKVSCASCHHPEAAFSDPGKAKSAGVFGRLGKRNSPSIVNSLWQNSFMWDGGVIHLNLVPLVPITDHLEMDIPWAQAIQRINQAPHYVQKFQSAFGIEPPVQDQEVLQAFAAFMGTLISSNSKYDQVLKGQDQFTNDELNGYMLFRVNCGGCHKEPLLTDHSFRNNGLDSVFVDEGRMHITNDVNDLGKFKVPSLRNVALTYPYMHDGRFQTLDEVLDHYSHGVKPSATLDSLLHPNFRGRMSLITHDQKESIIEFLHTLTDYDFIQNTQFNKPSNP